MVRSWVNYELKGMWKVALLSYFWVPPRHMSDRREGEGETWEIIASFRIEISPGDLRDTTQKCCPLNNGARKYVSSEQNYLDKQLTLEYISCEVHTGLFISLSGVSELDCATTKIDTAERSISIGRESLQVFFCTRDFGVLPGSTARG